MGLYYCIILKLYCQRKSNTIDLFVIKEAVVNFIIQVKMGFQVLLGQLEEVKQFTVISWLP